MFAEELGKELDVEVLAGDALASWKRGKYVVVGRILG
jgi:hypothetical protein